MRSYLTTSKFILLLCVFFAGTLTACSSDDDDDTSNIKPKEEVLAFIKYRLFDWKGNVNGNKLERYEPGEYNLLCIDEPDVRGYFTALTGIEIPPQSTYKCVYQSTDGKCKITIEGRQEALNGIFATIRFYVPEYPEIKILHFGTMAMMQATNGASSDMTNTDDLPHRVKGVN